MDGANGNQLPYLAMRPMDRGVALSVAKMVCADLVLKGAIVRSTKAGRPRTLHFHVETLGAMGYVGGSSSEFSFCAGSSPRRLARQAAYTQSPRSDAAGDGGRQKRAPGPALKPKMIALALSNHSRVYGRNSSMTRRPATASPSTASRARYAR